MISAISLNFLRADLSVRSSLHFSADESADIYQSLKGWPGLHGLMILSTCNRTEIYLDHEDGFDITVLLGYLQHCKGTSISIDKFDLRTDTPGAIKYFVEVANGLHSMVTGDKQILSQFKNAFRLSQANQMVSGLMERVFQLAVRSHKRIANQTVYHKGSNSISHLAIREIRYRFSDAAIPILVIGAGEIAGDLLKYLAGRSYSNVTVNNRTPAKSEALARQYGFKSGAYDLRETFVDQFQVVISCAGATALLPRDLQLALENKLLIDLTSVQSIPDVPGSLNERITLDDLARNRTADDSPGIVVLQAVKDIISQECSAFSHWMRERELRQNTTLTIAPL